MEQKFNIAEMLSLNSIEDKNEKQSIQNEIQTSYLNLKNDINENKNSLDALLEFKNKMEKYSNDNYDNSEEFNKWAKATGLKNIISIDKVKDEIMKYFNNAQDSKIRDNWNTFKNNDYINEDDDRFDSWYGWHSADEMINSYLPKNYSKKYNAYLYADLSYSRHFEPFGWVEDFDIKNITPEIKKQIFESIKNSDPDFFNNLEKMKPENVNDAISILNNTKQSDEKKLQNEKEKEMEHE